MSKKLYNSIKTAMETVGTFNQKNYVDNEIVVVPYLDYDIAKSIVKKYQKKTDEEIEFKKIKEDCFAKHNGNYIVKIIDEKGKYTFEIICKDKPFENRNPPKKKFIYKVKKHPTTETEKVEVKEQFSEPEEPKKVEKQFTPKTVEDTKKEIELELDGKRIYNNVMILLQNKGKTVDDLKNCMPVNMVEKIKKTKTLAWMKPNFAANLISYLDTDVDHFLGSKKVEPIVKETKVVVEAPKVVETPKVNETPKTVETVKEEPKKVVETSKPEKVATKNDIILSTIEPENVEFPGDKKEVQATEMLNETETKEVLEQEKKILVDRNSELLRNLISNFDVNAYLTLPEDFSFKQLAAAMRDEQKDDDKINSRDIILSSVFVNLDDCCRGGMSMEFVKNIKDIVDELYDNQKIIEGYNV